jgi:hypothetical protein
LDVFDVDETGLEQGVIEERFGFLSVHAMDYPASIGVDSRSDRIRDFGMRGQNQNGLHHSVKRTRRQPGTVQAGAVAGCRSPPLAGRMMWN